MIATPKPIKIAVMFIIWLWLNSFIAQILLYHAKHKASALAFLCWTTIYALTSAGLFKRRKIAYWSALVVSILQMAPLLISWIVQLDRLFGKVPGWYPICLYVSAVLGICLLGTLCAKSSRDLFFQSTPATAAE